MADKDIKNDKPAAGLTAPMHPYRVLAIAILLPGVGQLVNGQQQRAMVFIFFIMMFGWVTSHLAPPDASFIGRYAGGFFIHAFAVMDAYRVARIRWETYRHSQLAGGR